MMESFQSSLLMHFRTKALDLGQSWDPQNLVGYQTRPGDKVPEQKRPDSLPFCRGRIRPLGHLPLVPAAELETVRSGHLLWG